MCLFYTSILSNIVQIGIHNNYVIRIEGKKSLVVNTCECVHFSNNNNKDINCFNKLSRFGFLFDLMIL